MPRSGGALGYAGRTGRGDGSAHTRGNESGMRAQEFQTIVSSLGTEAVVALSGELDVASSQGFTEELIGLIEGGTTELVIDLTRLDFIDSTGLSAILQANRKLDGKGQLVLREPSPLVRQVLEVTGLTGALRIEP
ncbi:MAG: STAS domain-containing protein [Acidimicrobiales bacterium]